MPAPPPPAAGAHRQVRPSWRLLPTLFAACAVFAATPVLATERAQHPRAAAAEGRLTHPALSPELWPPDPAAAAVPQRLAEAAPRAWRVDVHVEAVDAALVERIDRHAERILHVAESRRRLTLRVVDREPLLAIAELPGVVAVEPVIAPVRRAGSVTSRAPRALRVSDIAPGLQLDGSGEKLGILSDSFARTAELRTPQTQPADPCVVADNGAPRVTGLANQDSGDLPGAVELFADNAEDAACPEAGSLTDEGAAMGELAHDIAPRADMAFHTAFISQASFAEGFEALCAPAAEGGAGASVVVDDVLFPTEPMYQPGVVAQAAAACVDAGVPVFSAAGNAAGAGFRAPYQAVDGGTGDAFGSDFHDWGDGSGVLPIELDAGQGFRAVLQWNQPWTTLKPTGTPRAPRIDLDLYLLDGPDPANASVVASSTRDQQPQSAQSGLDPWESFRFDADASGTYYLAIDHAGGPTTAIPQDPDTPLELRLVLLGAQDIVVGGEETPPGPGGPTLYGHSGADGVIAVGAVPWWGTPAFDPAAADSPTDAIDPQPFSSVGGELPRTFDEYGRFIGATSPLQPVIAAVDANNTTFFGTTAPTEQDGEPDEWPNFIGTSAAATNAAAVTLLLQQFADDGLAPLAIERLLADSAVDVTGERAAAGPDPVTGAGLIDAAAAVERFPIAVAGRDGRVATGTTAKLDGSASSGGRDQITAYSWRQTAGPDAALADAAEPVTEVEIPADEDVELAFELTITDSRGREDRNEVRLRTTDEPLPTEPRRFGSGSGGPCFIATAAFGTPMAAELTVLRTLRDDHLARTPWGRALIAAYEAVAPAGAALIAPRPALRATVRGLLRPAIVAAERPLASSIAVLALIVGLLARRERCRAGGA